MGRRGGGYSCFPLIRPIDRLLVNLKSPEMSGGEIEIF